MSPLALRRLPMMENTLRRFGNRSLSSFTASDLFEIVN
jgi:hypothetical protein